VSDLARIIEAILFVADAPVTAAELAVVTERPLDEVDDALIELATHLSKGHGIELAAVAGGWRLYTIPDVRDHLERFASTDTSRRLSKAATETLAVIAYRQPVSRGQVTEIRGVDSEQAIRTLERRDLVQEVGRAPGPGQAVLYGTTPLFLEKMGLASISDLPPLADHVPPAQIMETLEMPMRPERPSNDSTS
jgi:segregation and condensation protein B